MRIWRSPSAARSVTARRLRPISRWISWVRPLARPRRGAGAPDTPARSGGSRTECPVMGHQFEGGIGADVDGRGDALRGRVAQHNVAGRQEADVTFGMGRETAGEIVDRVVVRG